MPLFEQLQEKYADRDVVVLHLYVREPHPGERAFRQYEQPDHIDQRLAYARELVDIKGITAPVIVDEIDNAARDALGGLPNVLYVIGKDGRVHYKSSWADADKADRALAELVTADDPSHPVLPTFDTQSVGTAI